MVEALAARTKLQIVREIQEDRTGTTLLFQQGGHGRLLRGAKYEANLRLARRSRERQQPVGVSVAEGHTIGELIRADNDVPGEIWDDEGGRVRVLFHGHDGITHLKSDHSEFARIRALLGEAIRQKARVWFIVRKPDLALLDVLPAG